MPNIAVIFIKFKPHTYSIQTQSYGAPDRYHVAYITLGIQPSGKGSCFLSY